MMCMVFVHPVTIQLQRMYAKKRQGQGFECLTLVLPTDALSRDDVGVIAAAVGDEILEVGGLGVTTRSSNFSTLSRLVLPRTNG